MRTILQDVRGFLLQEADGTIWIAAGGGLARLDAEARTFATVRLHDHHRGAVRRLYRDPGGTSRRLSWPENDRGLHTRQARDVYPSDPRKVKCAG